MLGFLLDEVELRGWGRGGALFDGRVVVYEILLLKSEVLIFVFLGCRGLLVFGLKG